MTSRLNFGDINWRALKIENSEHKKKIVIDICYATCLVFGGVWSVRMVSHDPTSFTCIHSTSLINYCKSLSTYDCSVTPN